MAEPHSYHIAGTLVTTEGRLERTDHPRNKPTVVPAVTAYHAVIGALRTFLAPHWTQTTTPAESGVDVEEPSAWVEATSSGEGTSGSREVTDERVPPV